MKLHFYLKTTDFMDILMQPTALHHVKFKLVGLHLQLNDFITVQHHSKECGYFRLLRITTTYLDDENIYEQLYKLTSKPEIQ